MFRYDFGRLALLSSLVVACAPSVGKANLLTNYSFETGNFTGWTVAGNIGVYKGYGSSEGNYAAGFNLGDATPNGYIARNIPVTPGVFYTLEWCYAVRSLVLGQSQQLKVQVIGATTLVDVVSTDLEPTGAVELTFVPFHAVFRADAPVVFLKFSDVPTNVTASVDGFIDTIIVEEVPAPGAVGVLGLFACGAVRRRQSSPPTPPSA